MKNQTYEQIITARTSGEKWKKDQRRNIDEYLRGQRLGRRIENALKKLSHDDTPDVVAALRNAIASELIKIERRNAESK